MRGKTHHHLAISPVASSWLLLTGVVLAEAASSWWRPPRDAMVDASNDLGVALLQDFVSAPGNVALSPLAAAATLVALWEGARGDTALQLWRALELPRDRDEVRAGFRDLHRLLRARHAEHRLCLGDLFLLSADAVPLEPAYVDVLRFYGYQVANATPGDASSTLATSGATTPAPETNETTTIPATTITSKDVSPQASTVPVDVPPTLPPVTEETPVPPQVLGQVLATSEVLPAAGTAMTTMDVYTEAPAATTRPVDVPSTPSPDTTEAPAAPGPTTTPLSLQTPSTSGPQPPSAAPEPTTTPLSLETSSTSAPQGVLPASSAPGATETPLPLQVPSTSDPEAVSTPSVGTGTTTATLETLSEASTMSVNVPSTPAPDTEEPPAGTATSATLAPLSLEVPSVSGVQPPSAAPGAAMTPSAPQVPSTSAPEAVALPLGGSGTTMMFLETPTDAPGASTMPVNVPSTPAPATEESPAGPGPTMTPLSLDVPSVPGALGVLPPSAGPGPTMTPLSLDVPSVPGPQGVLPPSAGPGATMTPSSLDVPSVPGALGVLPPSDGPGAAMTMTSDPEGLTTLEATADAASPETAGSTTPPGLSIASEVPESSDTEAPRSIRAILGPSSRRLQSLEVAPFMIRGALQRLVPALRTSGRLPFARIDALGACVLQIPIQDASYRVLLILPETPDDLPRTVEALRRFPLRQVVRHLRTTVVSVAVPLFSLHGGVLLTSTLQHLGVWDVFDPRRADLSCMSVATPLHVVNVAQRVDLDLRPRPLHEARGTVEDVFVADRAFLFFVLDAVADVALLAGKVEDPLSSDIT